MREACGHVLGDLGYGKNQTLIYGKERHQQTGLFFILGLGFKGHQNTALRCLLKLFPA